MIRHAAAHGLRALPGGDVAAVAICIRCGKGVVVSDVAIRAGYDFSGRLQLMRAGQRPARRAVIKDRRVPGDGVMARRAIGRRKGRSGIRVDWIIGLLPGGQVTLRIPAISRRYGQSVVVVDVAIRAGDDFASGSELVRIGEWETRHAVIEGCGGPRDGVVTGRAVGRCEGRSRRGVHGIIRLLPGRQMAL